MKIKKQLALVLALCGVLAVFGGCKKPQDEVKNEYDQLNAMLACNYSQIDLTVTNNLDEDTVLVSEYSMKNSDGCMTVNYSIERFSSLSLDSVIPETTKIVGEAIIKDGNVSYVQGEEVNLDAIMAGTGFDFKDRYFENIDLTGVYFKADVTNPSGFIGAWVSGTEMKVSATFLEVFYDIKISYKTLSGNSVEYLYVFSL